MFLIKHITKTPLKGNKMSRIILATEPVTLSAIAIERARELCGLFPNFLQIGVNSLGVLYAEWRSELPSYMEIKKELLLLLGLPFTKDIAMYRDNEIAKAMLIGKEINPDDILSLEDLEDIDLHKYSDSDHMYSCMNYGYEENEVN